MPETRYIEEYDNQGNVIKKIPYEVSNGELERERAEQTVVELSSLPDAELTTTQMKRMVKALVKLRR